MQPSLDDYVPGRPALLSRLVDDLRASIYNLRDHVAIICDRLDAADALDSPLAAISRPGEPAPAPRYFARCLGTFALFRGGIELQLAKSHQGLGICRYLVAHAGERVASESLVELLWPDAPPELATHRLHVAVSSLRHIVDAPQQSESTIRYEDGAYLILESAVTTDCRLFDQYYDGAKAKLAADALDLAAGGFAEALSFYQGEYLADAPYEEWTQQPRAHFGARRLNALSFLCEHAERRGNYLDVMEYASAILGIDNLMERAHRSLMRAHYHLGQRAAALRQFATCAQVLHEELGVTPSRVTRVLYEAIFADGPLPNDTRLAL